MAAILCDSVIVCTCPRAIPLAMITMRKSIHGFPFFLYEYGAPLGGRLGRQSSTNIVPCSVRNLAYIQWSLEYLVFCIPSLLKINRVLCDSEVNKTLSITEVSSTTSWKKLVLSIARNALSAKEKQRNWRIYVGLAQKLNIFWPVLKYGDSLAKSLPKRHP